MKRLLFPLLLSIASLPLSAQSVDSSLASLRHLGSLGPTIANVERAVLRHAAQFESTPDFARQSAPLLRDELFPTYGFEPTSSNIEWDFGYVDENVVRLCFAIPIESHGDWAAFSAIKAQHRLQITDINCEAPRSFNPVALGHQRQVIYVYKDLDRRHAALPSKVSSDLGISLVHGEFEYPIPEEVNTPLARIKVRAAETSEPVTLWIKNTTNFEAIQVQGAYADPNWEFIDNTCGLLLQGSGCRVDVVFHAPADFTKAQAGQIRIAFNHVELGDFIESGVPLTAQGGHALRREAAPSSNLQGGARSSFEDVPIVHMTTHYMGYWPPHNKPQKPAPSNPGGADSSTPDAPPPVYVPRPQPPNLGEPSAEELLPITASFDLQFSLTLLAEPVNLSESVEFLLPADPLNRSEFEDSLLEPEFPDAI